MTSQTSEPRKSKVVSDDDLYRNSSQYRLWSFTKQQLLDRRAECHNRAVVKLQKSLVEKGITGSEIEPLSLEEEADLVSLYASKIGEIAKSFNMPSQVKATAISYFSKFYLVYSVMDYHPKNILYTSVFLASKAENYFIPIDKFCSALKRTEPKDILDSEFLLLESLSFTLAVQNPLMSLHGFFLDIQSAGIASIDESVLGQLHDGARAVIVDGFITDVMFLYTPPQIALAAMMVVNEAITLEYITQRFVTNPEQIEFLLSVIVECKDELVNIRLPSSDRGKEIDKKLHMCLNPDRKRKKRPSPTTAGPSGTSTPSSTANQTLSAEEPAIKRLKSADISSESTPVSLTTVTIDASVEPLADEVPEMTHLPA
ncbi:TFIIH complex kinase subunit CCL1 [Sugiyamaella lignohabitans]|uniref:TFIIH complex kinase subunit CCL1 n=1 Tax=Sugiyamaella lignohabitans TaxID=796027 RepID=A0A161HLN0_9ASCO|nr:TFIIH complex kinase subunit CCL1 [Sugiyamaella lignohabitans]ANB14327.1 TFIIH complex kinase subunit CCL1 [Sugiyamaella lignohabitans]